MDENSQFNQPPPQQFPPSYPEAAPYDPAPPGFAQPAAVWPPPPNMGFEQPVLHQFTFVNEKTLGTIDDFREGALGIDPNGLIINGRVQPRAEVYQTVLALTFLFGRMILALPAYLIMRYGCLKPYTCYIPSNMIQSVTLVPKKNKLCIAYIDPQRPLRKNNKPLILCLAMRFPPDSFETIIGLFENYAPGLAQPGKLKRGSGVSSLLLWLLLIAIVLVVGVGAMKFLGTTGH